MSGYSSLLSSVAPPKVRPGAVSPFPEGIVTAPLSPGNPRRTNRVSPFASPLPSPFPNPYPLPDGGPRSPGISAAGGERSPTGSNARMQQSSNVRSSLFGAPLEREGKGGGPVSASQPALSDDRGHGGRAAGLLLVPVGAAGISPRSSGMLRGEGGSSSPIQSTQDMLLGGQRRPVGPAALLESIQAAGARKAGGGDLETKRAKSSMLFGAPLDRFDAGEMGEMGGPRRRSFQGSSLTTASLHQSAVDDITPLPTEEDDDDMPLAADSPLSPGAGEGEDAPSSLSTAPARRKPTFTEERRDRVPPLMAVPNKFTNTSSWKEKSVQINISDFDKVASKLADVEKAGWFEGHMNMQMLDEMEGFDDDDVGAATFPKLILHRRISSSDDEDQYIMAQNAAAQFRASLPGDDEKPQPYVRHLVGAKPDLLRDRETRLATLTAYNAAIAASNQASNQAKNDQEILSSAAVSPDGKEGADTPSNTERKLSIPHDVGSRRASERSLKAPIQPEPKKGWRKWCGCFG
ncbi:hypothetical protein DFJ77DRAFT_180154 [Powellomyces hirtus]|nr:hypothetical protein DFJ77DRAFT_180154 [Powellomyces hirtus]